MNAKSENKRKVKGLPKMVLLNSEGNILTAYKKDGEFLIMDEFYEIVDMLTPEEIFKFTRGDLDVENSKNKWFNYMEFPGSMKPNLKELDEFIGVDTSGLTY